MNLCAKLLRYIVNLNLLVNIVQINDFKLIVVIHWQLRSVLIADFFRIHVEMIFSRQVSISDYFG